MLHADLSEELLASIFAPRTALHDGAVIIRGRTHPGRRRRPAAVGDLGPSRTLRHPPPRGHRGHRADRRGGHRGQRGDRLDRPGPARPDAARPGRGAAADRARGAARAVRRRRPGRRRHLGAGRAVRARQAPPGAAPTTQPGPGRRRPTRPPAATPAVGCSDAGRRPSDAGHRRPGTVARRRPWRVARMRADGTGAGRVATRGWGGVRRLLDFVLRNWPLKLAAIGLATVLYAGVTLSGNERTWPGAVPIEVLDPPPGAAVLDLPGSVTVHPLPGAHRGLQPAHQRLVPGVHRPRQRDARPRVARRCRSTSG